MTWKSARIAFVAIALPWMLLHAQTWDVPRKATGWSRADRDGSCTFLDEAGRKLLTWTRADGVTSTLELPSPKTLAKPELWALDSSMNAWIVCKNYLYHVAKNGKVLDDSKLPGEVADLAWDVSGDLYFTYKSSAVYVEKRSEKNGSLIWSYGESPEKRPVPSQFRLVVTEDNQVLVTLADAFPLMVLDAVKGKKVVAPAPTFTFKGASAPQLLFPRLERGALVWWTDRSQVVEAVSAAALPSLGLKDLLLVKRSPKGGELEIQATGLTEDHWLIGIVEGQALFSSPKGGLFQIAVQ